ncbi:unnamed protein product [Mytilus coruscus]|uniref:C-type lectin domain-containing protein n=1 Tax=Mytilus coruscus TaxID=42192 RepID=A0A6J8C9R4_MYTCO|nr:unnamed protein product [Mytilus coruscus]
MRKIIICVSVLVSVGNVDRGLDDPRNSLYSVLEEDDGHYKLGTAYGILATKYTRSQFIPTTYHGLKDDDIKNDIFKKTSTSSIACSTLCCMLGSCCYASYDKKTRQCILEESCCPQSELSADALMMKKSTDSLQCQNGWLKNENKCYYFSDDKTNWNDAKSICESYEGMLVEVISSCELDFLKTKATGYSSYNIYYGYVYLHKVSFIAFWLGGTDIEKEGNWIWSTSQTDITFNDWGLHQPSNTNGKEHCVQMKREYNLKWNDDPCMLGTRFICEKKFVHTAEYLNAIDETTVATATNDLPEQSDNSVPAICIISEETEAHDRESNAYSTPTIIPEEKVKRVIVPHFRMSIVLPAKYELRLHNVSSIVSFLMLTMKMPGYPIYDWIQKSKKRTQPFECKDALYHISFRTGYYDNDF